MAQLADDGLRFALHGIKKRRVLRILMAGEHEILPDEQAVFIAVVEKFVVFVNASAPATNHIAVAFREELQDWHDAFGIL